MPQVQTTKTVMGIGVEVIIWKTDTKSIEAAREFGRLTNSRART